jgi:hypothetical protein
VQFHPEVNRSIVEAWAAMPAAQEAAGRGDLERVMQLQMDEHLAAAEALGRTLADRWMKLVERA